MNDLFGEALLYIFGPIVAVFAIIFLIAYGLTETYQWVTGTQPVEQVQPPVKKETLSHKAGKKVKESGKEFIRGFFNKE